MEATGLWFYEVLISMKNVLKLTIASLLIVSIVGCSAMQTQMMISAKGRALDQPETGFTDLHYAVMQQSSERVKKLINNGFDVNATTTKHRTPLAMAVRANNPKIARMLLDGGAKPDVWWFAPEGAPEGLRGPLIIHAAQINSPALVRLLLEHGANPNGLSNYGISGNGIVIGLYNRVKISKGDLIKAGDNQDSRRSNFLVGRSEKTLNQSKESQLKENLEVLELFINYGTVMPANYDETLFLDADLNDLFARAPINAK